MDVWFHGAHRKAQDGNGTRKGFGLNAKLLGTLMPVIALALTVILLLVYASTSKIVLAKSEETLSLSTDSAINNISAWMNTVLAALRSERDALEFLTTGEEEELSYIRHTAGQFDAFPSGIYLGLSDGSIRHASFVPDSDYILFEKSWYTDGIKSEDFIFSGAYLDAVTNSNVVSASAVLRDKQGNIRGAAAADIYLDAIAGIVSQVKLEETGGLFLVDQLSGIIIGHQNADILGTLISEQQDPMYAQVSEFLRTGVMGIQSFDSAAGQIYLDLANVPNTSWLAVSYVPAAEIMSELNTLTGIITAIAVVSILVLLLLVVILLRRVIIRPIRQIDAVARRIAEGQLDESISYRSGDELGRLAANFNQTVDRLRDYVNYIGEISSVLDEVADGNLDFQLTYDYAGEFSKVKSALEHISLSLNDTLGQIDLSASQVSAGSEQVSAGAQALSQGATEQAASVEELAATIGEVSRQVKSNADRAAQANDRADAVGHEAQESNRRMQDMLTSMAEISTASGEIGKIMKTIEDIAFQTNILALNAAVEAARAGAAGKGFAVVADEVRNLANKSQEASKNTAALIEGSLRATERGSAIANETAQALSSVVTGVGEVASTIAGISQATGQQAQSIAQVNQGVDQISSVVQTNSATAEESAAASEELSAQAAMMKELVGRFRLKDNHQSIPQRETTVSAAHSTYTAPGGHAKY